MALLDAERKILTEEIVSSEQQYQGNFWITQTPFATHHHPLLSFDCTTSGSAHCEKERLHHACPTRANYVTPASSI
jgi:hypothetical protein